MFGFDAKSKCNETKNKQEGLPQTINFLSRKGNSTKWKGDLRNGGNFLQTAYLINGSYPNYPRNSCNSVANNNSDDDNLIKNGETTFTDIFLKNT